MTKDVSGLPGPIVARLAEIEAAVARNDGDMPSSAGPDAGPDAGESDDIPGAHS